MSRQCCRFALRFAVAIVCTCFSHGSVVADSWWPQSEINNSWDAIQHYMSKAGSNVPAGPGLYDSIRYGNEYWNYMNSEIVDSVRKKLASVSRSRTSGEISSSGYRGWNVQAIGSYKMNIRYQGKWQASAWLNNRRTIYAYVDLRFEFTDRWDFHPNKDYSLYDNLIREYGPEFILWIFGGGRPYNIKGIMNDLTTVTYTQQR